MSNQHSYYLGQNDVKPIEVLFEKIHSDAKLPTKGSEEAACWDVYSVEDAVIECGKVTVIDLGFKVKIPKGYEIVVRPRSGLAFKHGITIVNTPGTVDSDYRGPMKVALTSINDSHYNHQMKGDTDYRFRVTKGDRIAQIKLQEVLDWVCVEGKVDVDTKRGEGGFGSSGA